jgi:hypothetical protein
MTNAEKPRSGLPSAYAARRSSSPCQGSRDVQAGSGVDPIVQNRGGRQQFEERREEGVRASDQRYACVAGDRESAI